MRFFCLFLCRIAHELFFRAKKRIAAIYFLLFLIRLRAHSFPIASQNFFLLSGERSRIKPELSLWFYNR